MICLGAIVAFKIYTYYDPPLSRYERDVLYHLREGRELTYDVMTPENPNGIGLIFLVSGSWQSGRDHRFTRLTTAPFLRRGFTIFALYHLSQPEATVPEVVEDIKLGVRSIRMRADDWEVDPERLGIFGRSSGGHLAMCVATQSEDSPVAAAAVFFPVTDLVTLDDEVWYQEIPTHQQVNFGPEADDDTHWPKLARRLSPVYHIDPATMPPVLIAHGDADPDVPIEQSYRFKERADKLGAGPVELKVRPGEGHSYKRMYLELPDFAQFFEEQLLGE